MSGRDRTLTLYLKPKEGYLSVDIFQQALNHFVRLLPPTDDQGERINWLVTNLEIGSALLEFQPDTEYRAASDLVDSVLHRLRALESSELLLPDDLPPKWFIDTARKISSLAINHELETRVSAGSSAVYITERTLERADELLKNDGWYELGSIEGDLDGVNVHDSLQATLYPLLRGSKRVKCFFERDLLDQIKEALEHRVVVTGNIKYSADGVQSWIDVQRIEIMPADDDLPSIEEVAGIGADLFGPLSSEDYVRELRRDD